VQIPFEIKSGYIIFQVPVEPSGSICLLFDTGCQTTTFDKRVLERFGKKNAVTLKLGAHELTIENYHLRPQTGIAEKTGQQNDGVIGNDLLHRYTVKIDYGNRKLSLFAKENFIAFPDGSDIGIEVNKLVSSVPLVITFPGGQVVEGNFVIDTGAPVNVLINSPFAEEHGLSSLVEMKKEREFRTMADTQTASSFLAKSIRIGTTECNDMEIFISTSDKGLFAVTKYVGIVGNKFFQNFNVIFDYKRKRLNLEKY
jgi:hypothetical protein